MMSLLPTSCRKRSSPTSANTHDQSTNDENDISPTANNTNSNKQSSLFDLTTLSDIPSLEAAHTFESTSTNNSSSSSPLHNNNNNEQRITHSNEYYSAISSAHYRLQAAQTAHSHCISQLHVLKQQYERTLRELESARLYVRGVEQRWGVIDLESDNDDDDGTERVESAGKRRRLNRDQEQEVDVGSTNDEQSEASTISLQQPIEVTSSGEAIVNGIYHSTSSDEIYIHSEGPFYIHQQYYDVCIFPKVYAAKFRWCIGLVPCSISSANHGRNDGHDSEEEQGDYLQRTRDFELAFVYYWTMDLPLSSSNNDTFQLQQCDDDVPPSFASISWGACHGARPLPHFVQERKHWWKRWQFWRS